MCCSVVLFSLNSYSKYDNEKCNIRLVFHSNISLFGCLAHEFLDLDKQKEVRFVHYCPCYQMFHILQERTLLG